MEQKELGMNVKETTSSQSSTAEQLIERIEIEGTPFTIVKYENTWFTTMGKYRLSDPLPTKELAMEDAKRADWWRIMAIINIMIKENEETKPKKQETTEALGANDVIKPINVKH